MTDHANGRMGVEVTKVGAGAIAAALVVTMVDGLNTFGISLIAPKMAADLAISTASLGVVFACATAGMIVGSFMAGSAAAALGRVRALAAALVLMAVTAWLTPFGDTMPMLALIRTLAGISLGAAVPIAIGLLNRAGAAPPSGLVVNFVISGISMGAILAAVIHYFFGDWRSLFEVGGVLPLLGAMLVWTVYGRRDPGRSDPGRSAGPALAESGPASRNLPLLFKEGRTGGTVLVSLITMFGHIMAIIIFVWLPTIMAQEGMSISIPFAALHVGSIVSLYVIGVVSARIKSRLVLALAWGITGVLAIIGSLPQTPPGLFAVIAVVSGTLAIGTLGLTTAFANRIYHKAGLEVAMVGLAMGAGRVGQLVGLSLASAMLGLGLPARGLITMAGIGAFIAAGLAILVVRMVARDRTSMAVS